METAPSGRRRILLTLAAAALSAAALPLWFWGCGTSGYDAPAADNAWARYPRSATVTDNVLVDGAVLKSWVDAGLVNADADERVVVLEVGSSQGAWDNLHVPGALFLNQALLVAPRLDGVDAVSNEVPPGAQMDNLVQSLGIDERSTVVFSYPKATNWLWASRAYFTFRYWGFPKERLKFLDGGNGAYELAHGTAAMEGLLGGTAAFPFAARSSFSVRENLVLRDDLRASPGEMIRAAAGGAGIAVVDTRPSSSQVTGVAGSTSIGTAKAILEGRIAGARWIPAMDYSYGSPRVDVPGFGVGANFNVRPAETLLPLLASNGVDPSLRVYCYCTTGIYGSTAFLVLDGVLGWDAVLYDGSFSQWGILSDQAAHRGRLPAGSPWAVDALTVHGPLDAPLPGPTYNDTSSAYSFTPVNPWLPLDDPRANQAEEEDRAYMAVPADGGGAGGAGGAGSTGGGC